MLLYLSPNSNCPRFRELMNLWLWWHWNFTKTSMSLKMIHSIFWKSINLNANSCWICKCQCVWSLDKHREIHRKAYHILRTKNYKTQTRCISSCASQFLLLKNILCNPFIYYLKLLYCYTMYFNNICPCPSLASSRSPSHIFLPT